MRTKVTKTVVYPFDELSEDAKEKAVQGFWDINLFNEWWESIFEDAAEVYIELTEFELDRGSYCHGEFIKDAEDTAKLIIEDHGKSCETYKTAIEFIEDSAKLYMKYPVKLDDDGDDENETIREDKQEELNVEFKYSLLEDYRIILQNEYEHLGSEDVIIETIKINEYEFTVDGVLA